MIVLFLLSTIHVVIAWAWAFVTDTATTAVFEVFSLKYPAPALYGPDDPVAVHTFALLIKVTYTIAKYVRLILLSFPTENIYLSALLPMAFS